jgi:DNA-binding protein
MSKFITFKQWLNEAITPTVNKHMTHAEDLVILGGKEGLDWVIDMFKQLHEKLKSDTEKSQIKLSVKFDGAPSVFVWSKFTGLEGPGLAIKALFAKERKVMSTDEQIDHYYGEQKDLGFKLKTMLKYIPSLGIPENEIWQGDFLFDKTTLGKDSEHYSFHPNTIVYKVDTDSDLGEKISKADIGVVWHTRYTGESVTDISAKYNTKTDELKENPKVFMTDPYIPSLAGIVTLTEEENNAFDTLIEKLEASARNFGQSQEYKIILGNTEFTTLFTTFQNSLIRQNVHVSKVEDFLTKFAEFINNRFEKDIEAKKTPKSKEALAEKQQKMIAITEAEEVKSITALIIEITSLKDMFIKKLNNINKFETFLETRSGRYISTGDEGFAVSDMHGNIVKLVDRYEFSYANFSPNIKKGWAPK